MVFYLFLVLSTIYRLQLLGIPQLWAKPFHLDDEGTDEFNVDMLGSNRLR